jgi:hypothetical protein
MRCGMDTKSLRKSTENIVALLDIYEDTSRQKNADSISLKVSNYKLNYIKEKLLLSALENKQICEHIMKGLK